MMRCFAVWVEGADSFAARSDKDSDFGAWPGFFFFVFGHAEQKIG
jgi:hypothetical protein